MSKSIALCLVALVAGSGVFLVESRADAAGLYFSDRGVRPLSRAGAFVAGADDLGAISYNPAGIFDAGTQLMLDASWLHFTSEYSRQAIVKQLDPNTGAEVGRYKQTYPTVEGASPVLPLPTVGASLRLGEQWVIALGAWAPYAAIAAYPEQLRGKPAPQRYSLLNLDGSALVIAGAWAAYSPVKSLRIGVGFEALVGTFNSSIVFSGCVPDRFFCAPEQTEWDVLAQLSVGPIFAPSGNAGVIWEPHPKWRVGAAFQLPFWIRAPATIETRMPSASAFERAHQEGDAADVSFDLPWTIRAGVEARVIDGLRLELGFAYDRWSMHDEISIDPKGVALNDVAGFPQSYKIPSVVFPRGFKDSASVRLGGEYTFQLLGYTWDGRAGVSYETSAVPAEALTVLTLDAPKATAALGVSLHINRVRLDLTYAHIFASDVYVDPDKARAPLLSPVEANPSEPHYVNGGQYSSRADVLGVGIAYSFDDGPAAPAPAAAPKAKAPKAKAPTGEDEEPAGEEDDASAPDPAEAGE